MLVLKSFNRNVKFTTTLFSDLIKGICHCFYSLKITVCWCPSRAHLQKVGPRIKKEETQIKGMKEDRQKVKEESGRMMTPLSTSFEEAMTLLPPPTRKTVLRPHTNWEWQKIPVPVPGSPVFICFHTNKPGSGSSSPHAARSEQLSLLDYWQQWCGAISSLSHHRGKDHSHRLLSVSLPAAGILKGIPSEASLFIRLTEGAWVVVLVWDGPSVCVGAGFRCRESSLRKEWRLFSNTAGAEVDRE